MERVHCRRRYLGKKGRLEECRGSLGRIRREDECRSKETRKNRHGRRERFQKGRATRKVYSKNVVWMGGWKIRRRIFEEVGEKLEKVESSFSGEETLKGR